MGSWLWFRSRGWALMLFADINVRIKWNTLKPRYNSTSVEVQFNEGDFTPLALYFVTVENDCRQVKRVVKCGYWSRFMENKMAVSRFTDNKLGISRFTRKNYVFIRSVFLTFVKNYSQRTALLDISPFSRFLSLVLWKGKESRDFPRSGCRINTDLFPKKAPNLLGGPGVCSPAKCFGFYVPKVPFAVFLSHSDRILASSILLGWSICPINFPDFNLESFFY